MDACQTSKPDLENCQMRSSALENAPQTLPGDGQNPEINSGLLPFINRIIVGDNANVMSLMPDDCIDLIVTSPPYGSMRDYKGHGFDFEALAWLIKCKLKPGGVCVWVSGDQTIDGSESGTSFKQALHFMQVGLLLHDTMIYHRQSASPSDNRYWQNFEFMFVLSKGIPKTFNCIKDRLNVTEQMGGDARRQKGGDVKSGDRAGRKLSRYGARENIWRYKVGGGLIGDPICHKHPAPFPEGLATDHILTWSNEGDVVLDPFSGSGTTCSMAKKESRAYIGIEISEEYCRIAETRLQQDYLF